MNTSTTNTLIAIFLILLASSPVSRPKAGIVDDFAGWGAIQGQGSFAKIDSNLEKWQWWLEGQGRFFDDSSRLGQSIIRPGIGYKLAENISVWLGYGWVNTDPKGNRDTDEHRIWQQFSWNDTYTLGNFATRTRLEQRFLSNGDDTGWRFRQFVKYTHPLFSERLYLSIWDEVFVNINSTDFGANTGFGQNRAFMGLGVFIDADRHYRFELGYLNQFIDNENRNDQINHIISGSFFIRY